MFLRLRSKEYGEALLVNTEHIVAIADDRLGRGTLVSCRDQVEYRVVGLELELAVPRRDLDLDPEGPVHFSFKWADNPQTQGDVLAFTVNGDAAPNARFQYVFSSESREAAQEKP